MSLPKVRLPRVRVPAFRPARPAVPAWLRGAKPLRIGAVALAVAMLLYGVYAVRGLAVDDPTPPHTAGAPAAGDTSASGSAAPQPSVSTEPQSSSKKPGDGEPADATTAPPDTGGGDDDDDDDDSGSDGGGGSSLPGTGAYRIKAVHSGQCLDEGPQPGNAERDVIVQGSCSSSFSAKGLRSLGGGDYYLTLDHPEYGPGCVTIDGPGTGYLYAGGECGDDAAQRFRLSEVKDGVYRIEHVDSGTCLSIGEADGRGRAAAISATCGSGDDQRFTLV